MNAASLVISTLVDRTCDSGDGTFSKCGMGKQFEQCPLLVVQLQRGDQVTLDDFPTLLSVKSGLSRRRL